jgi:hypothetical protein
MKQEGRRLQYAGKFNSRKFVAWSVGRRLLGAWDSARHRGIPCGASGEAFRQVLRPALGCQSAIYRSSELIYHSDSQGLLHWSNVRPDFQAFQSHLDRIIFIISHVRKFLSALKGCTGIYQIKMNTMLESNGEEEFM